MIVANTPKKAIPSIIDIITRTNKKQQDEGWRFDIKVLDASNSPHAYASRGMDVGTLVFKMLMMDWVCTALHELIK